MSSRIDKMKTRQRLEAIERHVDEQVARLETMHRALLAGFERRFQALENGNATMGMVSALTTRLEAMERLKDPKPQTQLSMLINAAKVKAPKPPKASPVVCSCGNEGVPPGKTGCVQCLESLTAAGIPHAQAPTPVGCAPSAAPRFPSRYLLECPVCGRVKTGLPPNVVECIGGMLIPHVKRRMVRVHTVVV